MYQSSSSQTEKSRHLVMALQEERSALWALYCEMAKMKPYFSNVEILRPILSQFSQLLIDYVSLGHFGIYEHLLSEKQLRDEILSCVNRLYPAFSSTTVSAVSFSDVYDNGKRNFKTDNLVNDLSVLGEMLARRMELEDTLCSMLLH